MIFLPLALGIFTTTSSARAHNARDTYGPLPRISTTTDSVMPQMTTITDDILHSPYVSLQSITPRDLQTSTAAASVSALISTSISTTKTETLTTMSTVAAHATSLPSTLETAVSGLAMHGGPMVIAAGEQGSVDVRTSGPRWDCTKMCGKLTEDMECIEHVGCVDAFTQKGGLGKPASKSSSGGSGLSGGGVAKKAGVVLMLVFVGWALL